MEHYDVVIVGAGPAGLRCAEMLAPSDKKVLLLEKKSQTGIKVCAGGLTRKSLALMPVPETLFELKIDKARIAGPRSVFVTPLRKNPFAFMINRATFAQWQERKLEKSPVTIRHRAQVTKIHNSYVEINRQEQVKYTWLVGADGATSIVRRFLGLPVKKRLITFQYLIPSKENRFEIHMDNRYFRSGYGWIFPHGHHLAAGCLADPRHVPVSVLKSGFHRWLQKEKLNISEATYQSFPINYDYRGHRFGTVFLTGEAAGLASGLTGEGIFPALLSGEEIARMILDPHHSNTKMNRLLHYKKVQERFLQILHAAGPLRQPLFRAIPFLLNNKRFNRRITNGFS